MIVRNNFSIFDGTVIIAVPLVVEGDDYSIIRAYFSPLRLVHLRMVTVSDTTLWCLRLGSDGQLWQRQPGLHHHRQRCRVLGSLRVRVQVLVTEKAWEFHGNLPVF